MVTFWTYADESGTTLTGAFIGDQMNRSRDCGDLHTNTEKNQASQCICAISPKPLLNTLIKNRMFD